LASIRAESAGVVDVAERGGADMEVDQAQRVTVRKVRVGIDLVHVPDVSASIKEFGDRYLRRVYSLGELAACTADDGTVSVERLAARFAAKEAVIKALRPAYGVDYRSIEVVLDPDGGPAIILHRNARLLESSGIVSASVSLTHEGSYASAIYVALTEDSSNCQTPERPQ
jgi:holo-[acyl-carrier protein] synthase